MTNEELLKEASTYEILKTIAGCHIFIKMAMKIIKERLEEHEGGQFIS